MAERVSAKSKVKTELSKAVKNIKRHIESGGLGSKAIAASEETSSPQQLSHTSTKKDTVFKGRGTVYLSHVPHGFYEKEMHGFFSQFGRVTRLRLVRSHKTGNSRGYAFIEFLFSEVAQVVAETMNNYLMRNQLLKAQYIPSEKQNPKMFLHSKDYGPETCLGLLRRRRAVQAQRKSVSNKKAEQHIIRQKEKLQKLQEKLKAQGVDFLFQVDGGTSENLALKKSGSKPAQASAAKEPVRRLSSAKESAVKVTSGKAAPGKVTSGKAPSKEVVKKEKQSQPNKQKKEKINPKSVAKSNVTSKNVISKNASSIKATSKQNGVKNKQVKKVTSKNAPTKKVSVKELNTKKSVKKITKSKSVPKKK